MIRLMTLLSLVFPLLLSADIKANKEVVQTYYKAIVEQKFKTLDSVMAHNYQLIVMGEKPETTSDINKRARQWQKALPGFTLKVEELVAEGDKVVARTKLQGEHKGAFMGVAPTNKPIVMRAFTEFTVQNGKITRVIENWDELTIMKQLGVIVLN